MANEWTKSSRLQVAGAIGLAVLSVALGYSAFGRFMHGRAFDNGLLYATSNRPTMAVPSLQEALEWDSANQEARAVLAKVRYESGDLDGAQGAYGALEGVAKDVALYGQGAVALRRADRELKGEDPAVEWKAAKPHWKRARECFEQAQKANPKLIEAEIALRHCDLFALRRGPDRDPAKAAPIADGFKKALARVNADGAKSISREGLVDLHAGLGWAHSTAGESEEAAKSFRRCAQYAPGTVQARVNRVYLDARRFAETTFPLADLKAMEGQIKREGYDLATLWKSRTLSAEALKEPWFQYVLATAWAFARAGEPLTFRSQLNQAIQEQPGRLEPYLLDATVMAGPPFDPAATPQARHNAMLAFGAALSKLGANEQFKKTATPAMQAAVLHGLGCIEEQRAAWDNRDTGYEAAVARWREALAKRESYETCRNLAVVQKRRKKADAQEWYDKAVGLAASGDERVRADAEQLKKFWETP